MNMKISVNNQHTVTHVTLDMSHAHIEGTQHDCHYHDTIL